MIDLFPSRNSLYAYVSSYVNIQYEINVFNNIHERVCKMIINY